MDPATIGLVVGISAAVGCVGGGIMGYQHGVDEETHKLESARDKRTIERLKRKLRVAYQESNDRMARDTQAQQNAVRRVVTPAEFADPIKYMINTLNENPKTKELQKRVSVAIDHVLAQPLPTDRELNQCLMWAVRLGSKPKFIEYINRLVARGADVNHVDATGECPLSMAIYFCAAGAVQALLSCENIDLEILVNGESLFEFAQARRKISDETLAVGYTGLSLIALKAYQVYSAEIMGIFDPNQNHLP